MAGTLMKEAESQEADFFGWVILVLHQGVGDCVIMRFLHLLSLSLSFLIHEIRGLETAILVYSKFYDSSIIGIIYFLK